MREYKNKIAAAVIVAVVLTFAYWWGGNSPELHGWKPQPKDDFLTQTHNSKQEKLDSVTEKAEVKEESKKKSVESVLSKETEKAENTESGKTESKTEAEKSESLTAGKGEQNSSDSAVEKAEIKEEKPKKSVESVLSKETEKAENKESGKTESKTEAEKSESSTAGKGEQKNSDSAVEKAEIKEEKTKKSVESVLSKETEKAENKESEKTESKTEAEKSESSTAGKGEQNSLDSAAEKAETKWENESKVKENIDFSDEKNNQSLGKDGNGNDGAQTLDNSFCAPAPIEPENEVISDKRLTCTLSVRCDTILKNIDFFDKEKTELVPKNGVIFAEQTVTFYEGESVFNLLLREMKRNKIHMEFKNTPIYNSAYIEGIGNLYEFDCGELSGWMYSVNGWFPNYGCSRYKLKEGDKVEWRYTCNLGEDIGGNYARNGFEK